MASTSPLVSRSGSEEIINKTIEDGSSSKMSSHEGKTWSVRNPRAATALKFGSIGLVALLIIGTLVGIGASGGFGADGWLQQTALPAIKKAFEEFAHWVVKVYKEVCAFLAITPDMNVWQGLAYVATPIVGAMIIGGVTYKYIVPCAKEMYAEHQQKKADEKEWMSLLVEEEGEHVRPEDDIRLQPGAFRLGWED